MLLDYNKNCECIMIIDGYRIDAFTDLNEEICIKVVDLGGCPSNTSSEANRLGFFGCFSFGSEITRTGS
jgi:hypothetical protein